MNVTDVGHKVLGLRLSEWQPAEEVVPDEIAAAGYEIEDTPQGPRAKTHRRLK